MLMEFRDQRAILRVAGTCVNDDAKISGLDNEGLQAHQVLAVGSDKSGLSHASAATCAGVASAKKSTVEFASARNALALWR
jgi:hypothetical protein